MALKTYKPIDPRPAPAGAGRPFRPAQGRSGQVADRRQDPNGGRNNTGRIIVRWQGGGHKQRYRIIDFKRRKFDVPAKVERLEYDPNRTAFIALIKYKDGELAYILAPQRLAVGDTVVSGDKVDVKPGNAMPLGAMPVGTIVHNIEMKPGKGGQIARSAGTYAQYLGRDAGYALLRLNSGESAQVADLHGHGRRGVESRPHERIDRQGRPQCLEGQAPAVRGTAMNPIDHPHGGGEGRTKGGRHPVTPWGKPTKGKKTRNNKRTTKFIVRTRKGKKKG